MTIILEAAAVYLWTGCAVSLIGFWRAQLLYPVSTRITYALLWPLALIAIPDRFVEKYGRGASGQ